MAKYYRAPLHCTGVAFARPDEVANVMALKDNEE